MNTNDVTKTYTIKFISIQSTYDIHDEKQNILTLVGDLYPIEVTFQRRFI